MLTPGPAVAALVVLGLGTLIGISPMKKLIMVHEARHELRQGSAGAIRSIGGWAVIALWLMGVWFLGTIIGDWGVTGDLGAAIDRSMVRLRILLEIAAALAESD